MKNSRQLTEIDGQFLISNNVYFIKFSILLTISFFIGGNVNIFGQQEPNNKPIRSEIVTGADFALLEEIKKVKNCRKSSKVYEFGAMAVHGLEGFGEKGFGGTGTIRFFEHQFRYKQNGKDVRRVFLFSILSREEPVSSDKRPRVEFIREKGV